MASLAAPLVGSSIPPKGALEHLRLQPFVYGLYDARGDLLYIGATRDLGRRLIEHAKTKVFARWYACPTPPGHHFRVEAELIRRHRPPLNRQRVA